MSEFPTSGADIKALRIKILRALSAVTHPRMAIGSVAGHNGLTVEDVKSLVTGYGWPEPRDMQRHAFELEGKTPPAVVVGHGGAPAPATQQPAAQVNVVERLLHAAERSKRARTKKLAAKIRAQLDDLREMVVAEHAENEQASAAAAEQTRLKAEVDALEQQLAAKKALLKGKVPSKARASTTPRGDAKDIRAWAAAHSVACPERGRVPGDVVEAYELAHQAAS